MLQRGICDCRRVMGSNVIAERPQMVLLGVVERRPIKHSLPRKEPYPLALKRLNEL